MLAAALVVASGQAVKSLLAGRRFTKMTGSGNDFIFFGGGSASDAELARSPVIQRLCARGTGIGADGLVLIQPSAPGRVRMTYYNADGTEAALCGNASLCSTRLAVDLGMGPETGFLLETAVGDLAVRLRDGLPEVDLQPVEGLQADASHLGIDRGEERLGFALVGVPHVVIRVADLEAVDVVGRGRPLRSHPALSEGANVNFVAPRADGSWAYRTYERGVEDETLACGTGAVAIAALLEKWGESGAETQLQTRSGRILQVVQREGAIGRIPSLRGEGRIVFTGEIGADA